MDGGREGEGEEEGKEKEEGKRGEKKPKGITRSMKPKRGLAPGPPTLAPHLQVTRCLRDLSTGSQMSVFRNAPLSSLRPLPGPVS